MDEPHDLGRQERELYPIGINLSLLHLTSAYVSSSDQVANVALVTSSPAWQDFYLETLRRDKTPEEREQHSKSPEVEGLITSTLTRIRQATESQLQRSIEVFSVSYPEHLRRTPYFKTLALVARKVYPELYNDLLLGPYMDYVRLGYGLDTPEALRYPSGTDLDLVNPLLIHFDWQKDVLEGYIMSVDHYACIREQSFLITKFGDREQELSPEDLQNFREHTGKMINNQIRDSHLGQTQPEDFRWVVFSGSVDGTCFKKLCDFITDLFPEFAGRFKTSIEPRWAAAWGSAFRARVYKENPWKKEKLVNSTSEEAVGEGPPCLVDPPAGGFPLLMERGEAGH